MSSETGTSPALPDDVRLDIPVTGQAATARGSAATAMPTDADFLRRHALLPLLAFVALATVAMAGQGDLWIADCMYAWGGGRWALRDAWATQQLVHLGGRNLSVLMWLLVLAAWSAACLRKGGVSLRRPLAYLLVATLASTSMVSLLKGVTGMDCPWDLARYGGRLPAVGLFELRPPGLPEATCFPAGHASGGYAWLAVYFFLRVVHPPARYGGLVLGLALGLVFGVAQQLRGAHFASHDLWTAAICWFTALGAYLLFWPPRAGATGSAS